MLETFIGYFSHKFIVYAFIVGGLVSLCASLLGVMLVLRRCSMIGDGLSHVAFGALAVSVVLGTAPLAFSIPVVILAAFLLLRVSENSRVGGDAAIAMISTFSLAVGVIAVSMTTGMNTDITAYMFGSVSAMEKSDVVLSVVLSVIVVLLYLLFFNRIFAITFDESFAKATGLRTEFYKFFIAVVTAVTIVVGMHVIGAMLISALIIFPALTAMRVFKSFRSVVICAATVSVAAAFIGISASCLFSLPTGAAVVAANAAFFAVFSVIGALKTGKG